MLIYLVCWSRRSMWQTAPQVASAAWSCEEGARRTYSSSQSHVVASMPHYWRCGETSHRSNPLLPSVAVLRKIIQHACLQQQQLQRTQMRQYLCISSRERQSGQYTIYSGDLCELVRRITYLSVNIKLHSVRSKRSLVSVVSH
jgi:hypothetical protein